MNQSGACQERTSAPAFRVHRTERGATQKLKEERRGRAPGKPQMMSVASCRPGTAARSVSATRQNSAAVYSRRIAPSTAFDPDCTGTCRYANTAGWFSACPHAPGDVSHLRARLFDHHVILWECGSCVQNSLEGKMSLQCTFKPVVAVAA